jgi:uncharacterized damage-inducible protein DinB
MTSLLIAIMLATPAEVPQASSAASTIGSVKVGHDTVKGWLLKAADQLSEENYAFKPTKDVRSAGEIFGHIADANFMICGSVSGQKAPMSGVEKSKKTKADLRAALDESFKFCDAAFASVTDANANEAIKFFIPGTHTRLGVLAFNNAHEFEHYGNIVTYMRLKGLVPPSTAGGM